MNALFRRALFDALRFGKRCLFPVSRKCVLHDFFGASHGYKRNTRLYVIGNIGEIADVRFRNQNRFYAVPPGRNRLFSESADRQNLPRKRKLARHRKMPLNNFSGEQRHKRRRHRNAGGRAVFFDRAFGNVQVNYILFKPLFALYLF